MEEHNQLLRELCGLVIGGGGQVSTVVGLPVTEWKVFIVNGYRWECFAVPGGVTLQFNPPECGKVVNEVKVLPWLAHKLNGRYLLQRDGWLSQNTSLDFRESALFVFDALGRGPKWGPVLNNDQTQNAEVPK